MPEVEAGQSQHMDRISLAAVGDIMLGRRVGKKIKAHGADFPFQHVSAILREADIVFGDLESPLSLRGEPCQTKRPDLPFFRTDPNAPDAPLFRADPDAIAGLVQAGFNVLSLANNHILDYGEAALRDTVVLLERHGVHSVGIGANLTEARRPLLLVRNGVRVAFLAYSSQFTADESHTGNPPLEYRVIKEDVIKARRSADHVIVSLHLGIEYSSHPLPLDRQMLHQIIDDGASLIVGHHPHVLQGIEQYKKGLIAYSLGNFVFDMDEDFVRQMSAWSQISHLGAKFFDVDPTLPTESVILQCVLTKREIVDQRLVPIRINSDYQPTVAQSTDGQQIVTRLKSLGDTLANERAEDRLENVLLTRSLGRRFMTSPVAMLRRVHRIRGYHLRLVPFLLKEFGQRLGTKLGLLRDPGRLG